MVSEIRITTRDGTPLLLRRLTPQDEPALRAAIESFSKRTRYLRFFSGAQSVPDHIIHKLADVDGVGHLAWAAIDERAPGQPVIGAVHAIRNDPEAATAEFAIGLVDDWHAKGISRLLIALLAHEALEAGITELTAEVLWDNRPGRLLMKAIGATSRASDPQCVGFAMQLEDTLATLRSSDLGPSMDAVLHALDAGRLVTDAA